MLLRGRALLVLSVTALVVTVVPGVPVAATAPGVNGPIAFVSNQTGNLEIFTVNPDGTGPANVTNDPGNDQWAAMAPDGQRLAFASDRDGDWEIYVMNLNGGGLVQLTSNTAADRVPAWSPAGDRIAFQSDRDGNEEIYVMNVDGSGQTNLTNHPTHDQAPDFSPDGTRVAFFAQRDGNNEVYVMNADGSGQTNLTNNAASDGSPSWAPDGSRIAFDSNRAGDPDVWTMNPDGSDPQLVTQSTAGDYQPSWSPDGSLIAFTSDRDGNQEIYRIPATGGATLNLTNRSSAEADAAWGPLPLDPVQRLFGPERIATAVAISVATYGPGPASAAVLARSDLFPDALAGTPLAVAVGGPILLTETRQLSTATSTELQRVLPAGSTVYLLGSTAALSTQVEADVQALGYATTRLGGANRFATAVAIAQALGLPSPLYIADGGTFQAALVSGVAAAQTSGAVLLTAGSQMPDETQTYINNHAGTPRTAVGVEAIQADPAAAPVGGADASEVSRNLANQVYGPAPAHAALASATVFADGLAGGPHIAFLGGPLLLTEPTTLSQSVREYLFNHAAPIGSLVVYGGPAAITDNVVLDAQRAISGIM